MALQKHFPGQLADETIYTVIHRHWFNILSHFIAIIFLTFLILIFYFFAEPTAGLLKTSFEPSVVSFITTTALLFLWLYAFFIWIDYYFDVWVITNERVLNVEQKGLFTRIISEVHLGRVQDVTTKVEGFLPTLLHYGDIFVQTAGEEKHFHFRNVGDPDKHKDDIVKLVKKIRERKYAAPGSPLEESL
jgi:uncharacterized membrane protein YdbT with pleckstrin-like domain